METNVILFSLYDFPKYLKNCIAQIKHHSPETNIHLISDKDVKGAEGVNVYHINQFLTTPLLQQEDVRYFQDNPVKEHKELFFSSAVRFLYIEELARKLNLKNIFTFDNDVLIYENLQDVVKCIPSDKNIAITQALEDELICAMTYFRTPNDLVEIAGDFKSIFRYTEEELNGLLDLNGKHPNEMGIIWLICKKRPLDYYVFSSIPNSDTDLIFDPISYGQYISGLSSQAGGTGEPFIDEKHFIGKQLKSEELSCWFNTGAKAPFVKNKHGEFKLSNLHVHGKNLDKFISY